MAIATTSFTRDEQAWDVLVAAVQTHFNQVVARNGSHLFLVETGVDLYQVYLNNLPADDRQHHTCTCCQRFIQRFGTLASVNPDGTLTSVWWNTDNVPEFYRASMAAMARAVASGQVQAVAFIDEEVWGKPETGTWTHFAIKPPAAMVYKGNGLLNADQAMAVKVQNYETLCRGLGEYKRDVVAQALTLLEANALYRAEKVIGPARFLLKLHDDRAARKGNRRNNITWLAVASSPDGFCHPKTTMVGKLMDDIVSGLDFEEVKRRFDAEMNPTQYQRPQAPPTAGNIKQAEKVVEKLGIEASLRRRYARLDEIQTVWTPKPVTPPASGGGVFSYLLPKGAQPADPLDMPAQDITWEKFARTVLPNAIKMEAYLRSGRMRMCALVTAVDADAPPIIQWDLDEQRNPFSWYVYDGGSTAEHWSLRSNTWVNVTAVSLQPNQWYRPELFSHQGQSAILILEGARDVKDCGLALFPEILKANLREVRSTIEAHSKFSKLEGGEQASACGLRVGEPDGFNQIRVTTANGVAIYKIDRWD